MTATERRLEVRLISPQALRQYMAFRQYTIRSLAKRVGCSHSTIGHLTTGARKNASPRIARGIAEALDCPVESLFAPRRSSVQREVRRTA